MLSRCIKTIKVLTLSTLRYAKTTLSTVTSLDYHNSGKLSCTAVIFYIIVLPVLTTGRSNKKSTQELRRLDYSKREIVYCTASNDRSGNYRSD